MGTHWHKLTPESRTTRPTLWASISVCPNVHESNTDTRRQLYSWRRGFLCHGRFSNGKADVGQTEVFDSPAEMIGRLYAIGSRKDRLWVVSSTAAVTAQLSGLTAAVSRDDCQVESWCLSDPPIYLLWRRAGKRMAFVSLANYGAGDPNEVAAMIGAGPAPCLASATEPAQLEAWARWECECTIWYAMGLCRLHAMLDLGRWAPTLAGIAWHTYLRSHLASKVYVHANEETIKLERAAYYGGDVTPWRVGREIGGVYHLDANALYPSVMVSGCYPTRLVKHHEGGTVADLSAALKSGGAVASVRILSLDRQYPGRTKSQRMNFRGSAWTALAGPELAEAISLGHVKTVGEWAQYECTSALASWGEFWYATRARFQQQEDSGSARLCKLIANSLSGRLAQRSGEWIPAPGVSAETPHGEWWHRNADTGERSYYSCLGRRVMRQVRRRESEHAMPAVGAYITSYGRVRMERLRRTAGVWECFYHDTDSLFASSAGLARLRRAGEVCGSAMGKLRLVGGPATLLVRAAKSYDYDGKTVQSGLSRRAVAGTMGMYDTDHRPGARLLLSEAETGTVPVIGSVFRLPAAPSDRDIDSDGWTWARMVCE